MLKSILVLITLSFFCGTAAWLFFIWAVKKGSFDDVEGPKYRMMEDDDEPQSSGRDQTKNNSDHDNINP
jgi:cbb3-type cytochrome oxidase maturation protein